jgi:hypothetical protein
MDTELIWDDSCDTWNYPSIQLSSHVQLQVLKLKVDT